MLVHTIISVRLLACALDFVMQLELLLELMHEHDDWRQCVKHTRYAVS